MDPCRKGEDTMDMITALAVSIGLLGGVATWLFLGPLGALGLSIWAAFVGWATFYHSGGKEAGLKKAIVNNLFGAVVAWVALILISKIPLAGSLGLPVWAAICVAITVFVLVYAAKYPLLATSPPASSATPASSPWRSPAASSTR